MTAVQFSQPPGPPGGMDGLHGTLVVELAFPVDSQASCLILLTVFWSLQTLRVGTRALVSFFDPQ